MLGREEAMIKRFFSIEILADGICPQGIFLLLDLTMSWKSSKAYFENGLESLRGQLHM